MVLSDLVGMIREVPWGNMLHRGYWPPGTPFMAYLWAVPKGHPHYDPAEAGVLHVVPSRSLSDYRASEDSSRNYVYMVFLMGQFPSLRAKTERRTRHDPSDSVTLVEDVQSFWVMNETDLVAMKLVFGGQGWHTT